MKVVWKRIEELKPGEILGDDVYDSKSFVLLLQKGSVLSKEDIEQLKDRKVIWVPVKLEEREAKTEGEELESAETTLVESSILISEELPPTIPEDIYDDYISSVSDLINNMKSGIKIEVSQIISVCSEVVEMIRKSKEHILNLFTAHTMGYIRKHLVNTSIMAVMIGSVMKLPRHRLISLAKVGLVHDIGWTFIYKDFPDVMDVGDVPENLMKFHPIASVRIIMKYTESFLASDEVEAILHHHERYDGKGFPFGVSGKRINELARILQFADVFDTLTSDAMRDRKFTPYHATKWIINRTGTCFDPDIAKHFFRLTGIYPTGTKVRLSDGRIGLVVRANPDAPMKPVVRLKDTQIDLSKVNDIWIEKVEE